jgi:RHS repeat-associated protein
VFSDRKIPEPDGQGQIAYYTADVVSYSDYYPFGMELPGRSFNSNSVRYGFNGMEKDDEISGSGNSYTTEFRQYDPRIGRWWSVDPEKEALPWQSPYVAMNNSPIQFNDPEGDYIKWAVRGKEKRQLRRHIRKLRREDDAFNAKWKEWRSDNDRHTIFKGSATAKTGRGATQDPDFPFIYTNSDKQVKDKRRGTGTVVTRKRNGKEVTEEINKTVTNHHHYISTPNYSLGTETFDIDFKNSSNEITTDFESINDFINDNNIREISVKIATSANRNEARERDPTKGIILDGETVMGGSINNLLRARENEVKDNLDFEGKINVERSFTGKSQVDREVDTQVRSTVTIKTITYNN